MSTLGSLKQKFGVGPNKCLNHSNMITQNHWLYCPHCGIKLQFIAKCKECGQNFTSEKSYNFHVSGKFDEIRKVGHQHLQEVGSNHRIVFQGRRGVFYCCDCRKELKLSP